MSLLTVVILTLNEEERIARCLRSLEPLLPNVRVVIIDSWSKDQTLEVAEKTWRKMGARSDALALLTQTWKGFTETRQASLKWVKTPWVLWLDADEWLTRELVDELRQLPRAPSESDALVYRIPRLSYFLGRPIRHGGWYPDRKSRLAQAALCEWKPGPRGADVHEDLFPVRMAHGFGLLHGHIEHEPFRNEGEQGETNRRYSTLLGEGLARSRLERGLAPPHPWWIRLRGVWKFFENYIWKGGFLDGRPGYLIARGSSDSLRLRYECARARMLAPSVRPQSQE